MSSVYDASPAAYAERKRQEASEAEKLRTRENHRREMEELEANYAKDREQAQAELNERLQEEKKSASEEVRRLKDELYGREGTRAAKGSSEINDEKNRLQNYREDLQREYERRSKKNESAFESRIKSQEQQKVAKSNHELEKQKLSHDTELKQVRDALRQAMVDPRDVDQERAMARQSAIRQVEGGYQADQRRIVDAYEISLQQMKDQQDSERLRSQERMTEVQYEALGKANQMMREQREGFIRRDQQRVAEIKQKEDRFGQEVKREQNMRERGAEVLRANHESSMQKALRGQAQSFDRYEGERLRALNHENKVQTEEIQKLKTTDDEFAVSPALINRIHRAEEARHFGEREALRQHHLNQEEGLKSKDARERQELMDSYQEKVTAQTRNLSRKLDQERSTLVSAYTDLKESKEKQIDGLRDRFSSSVERNQIRHAQELNLQQKKDLEKMEQQRESLNDQKRSKVEEVQFQSKVQGQENLGKMSSLKRDYENKLADLQLDHEMKMNEFRLESDSKYRELERRSNRGLEDRVKAYEHQLKQQEISFKEKERFLTEHYEEQIDKLKRTNARLIQKKS